MNWWLYYRCYRCGQMRMGYSILASGGECGRIPNHKKEGFIASRLFIAAIYGSVIIFYHFIVGQLKMLINHV